jgi:hypothetical protein
MGNESICVLAISRLLFCRIAAPCSLLRVPPGRDRSAFTILYTVRTFVLESIPYFFFLGNWYALLST